MKFENFDFILKRHSQHKINNEAPSVIEFDEHVRCLSQTINKVACQKQLMYI